MGNPFLLSSNERHQGVCKVHSSFVETICFLPYAGSIQPVLEMAAARQTRLGRVPAYMFAQSPTKTDRRWPVAYQVGPFLRCGYTRCVRHSVPTTSDIHKRLRPGCNQTFTGHMDEPPRYTPPRDDGTRFKCSA
jgi:hypothetical protein